MCKFGSDIAIFMLLAMYLMKDVMHVCAVVCTYAHVECTHITYTDNGCMHTYGIGHMHTYHMDQRHMRLATACVHTSDIRVYPSIRHQCPIVCMHSCIWHTYVCMRLRSVCVHASCIYMCACIHGCQTHKHTRISDTKHIHLNYVFT